MNTATKFTLKMPVNKKENGKYALIGVVSVPVFSLADFGLAIQSNGVDKDGLPTYGAPAVQYVQDAVTALIKAAARNKLQPESVETRAGASIATSVAELLESGGNNGAALALHREFVVAFTAFLKTSGKAVRVQEIYSGLARNKSAIALATEAARKGFATQLEGFLATLSEEDIDKYLGLIEGLSALTELSVDLSEGDY